MERLHSTLKVPVTSDTGLSVDLELNTYFQSPISYNIKIDDENMTFDILEKAADQIIRDLNKIKAQDLSGTFSDFLQEFKITEDLKNDPVLEELALLYPINYTNIQESTPEYTKTMDIINNRIKFLQEKIQFAVRAINPFEGEREDMFKSLFPFVTSNVLWSEYRKRREADLVQFLTKYERPEKIHKAFKIMKEMSLHDVRIITQPFPVGLAFLGLASLTSLVRDLYLETVITNIQSSLLSLTQQTETPKQFQLPVQTISNIVSTLTPGINIYLVQSQKQWIFRQASIVKATPGSIYLTYRDRPDTVCLNQISFVPELYVDWDDLLPLMSILVPMKEQGYYQIGEVLTIRSEEITVLYNIGGERKKDNLAKQLYSQFLLAPSTHGLNNTNGQIYCYVLLLQDYIEFIITQGRENGEDNLESDLRRKSIASVFNSMGTTVLADVEERWNILMKYMTTLPDGEDRIIEIKDEKGGKRYIFTSLYEIERIINFMLYMVERKVFGTIDILAPQIMTAIKILFIKFYTYLTDTNRGTVNITAALGTYLYLTKGTYLQEIGRRMMIAYQTKSSKGKSNDTRITEEYFRSTCEIELYENSFVESVLRECLCVFRVSAFTNISLQDWGFYKPYYEYTRCTDGIRLWSMQIMLLTQSLAKYIGPFSSNLESRYILRKTLYESVLTLSSIYMVITPSRARVLQYKIDIIYIVSLTLYYIMYSEPLKSDKSEDNQNNFHEQILNLCRKMLARAVLICGLWQNVVGFLQDLTKEPDKVKFYEDTTVKYTLHQLLKIKKIDMSAREPISNFLEGTTNYFTVMRHEEIKEFEISWEPVLKPCPLTVKEVYELIQNRFELTAEAYPPLTEQQEEGVQPLKAQIALFEASFIK